MVQIISLLCLALPLASMAASIPSEFVRRGDITLERRGGSEPHKDLESSFTKLAISDSQGKVTGSSQPSTAASSTTKKLKSSLRTSSSKTSNSKKHVHFDS
ncbi:hypothetical protein C8J56DRAFT_387249 [Mycena floridula]|nr:hypothetical protein C8J56DRAFT_387249 [Mycena floridula]